MRWRRSGDARGRPKGRAALIESAKDGGVSKRDGEEGAAAPADEAMSAFDEDAALVDGRRRRSERSRLAIARALLDAVRDTGLPPTVDEIAQRAGVSRRSVFRHFGDMTELYATAIVLQRDDVSELFPGPELGHAPLEERIRQMAVQLGAIYERCGAMIRVFRLHRSQNELLQRRWEADIAALRHFVGSVFSDCLADYAPPDDVHVRNAISLALDPLTWETMREELGLSAPEARAVMARTLAALVGSATPDVSHSIYDEEPAAGDATRETPAAASHAAADLALRSF